MGNRTEISTTSNSAFSLQINVGADLDINLNPQQNVDHSTSLTPRAGAGLDSDRSGLHRTQPDESSGGGAVHGDPNGGGSGGGGSSANTNMPLKRPNLSGGGGGSNLQPLNDSLQTSPAGGTFFGSSDAAGSSGSTGDAISTSSDSADGATTASPTPSVTSASPAQNISLGFAEGLDKWNIQIEGGSDTGHGSVSAGSAILNEGDSFLVSLDREFVVAENQGILSFRYTDLNFDMTDANSINDAFEASLLDSNGQTLVHTFGKNRDAFFNITESESAALGSGTTLTGDIIHTVSVDLSGVQPGTSATLQFRLVTTTATHRPLYIFWT